MLPGPLSAQDTVPVALRSVLEKLTADPPATTVVLDGETEREGVFPPPPASPAPPLLLPPQPMTRQSTETAVRHRAFDMSDSRVSDSTGSDGSDPLKCS